MSAVKAGTGSRSSKSRSSKKKRLRVAMGVVVGILGPGAYLTAAALTSNPASAASTYQGAASASLVTADALDVPGTFDLANAQVAPANSAVDSAGGLTSGSSHRALVDGSCHEPQCEPSERSDPPGQPAGAGEPDRSS